MHRTRSSWKSNPAWKPAEEVSACHDSTKPRTCLRGAAQSVQLGADRPACDGQAARTPHPLRRQGHEKYKLAPRMMPGMQDLQPGAGDMGINLRRGDIGVTEQHLHGAQIGTVIQQVGGKSMTQRMR